MLDFGDVHVYDRQQAGSSLAKFTARLLFIMKPLPKPALLQFSDIPMEARIIEIICHVSFCSMHFIIHTHFDRWTSSASKRCAKLYVHMEKMNNVYLIAAFTYF